MCKMQSYNKVITHPRSTQEHTHAHTTSHSRPALFNIRHCGLSSTPNERHDTFLCFSAPLFLRIADVDKLNNGWLFPLLPKTVQLLFVSAVFLCCCCCCCGPETPDNGSFRKGEVPVFLRRRLNTSGWIISKGLPPSNCLWCLGIKYSTLTVATTDF